MCANRRSGENEGNRQSSPLPVLQVVVPADAPIAKTFKNGDDIWIVTLEEAMKGGEGGGGDEARGSNSVAENNERIVVNSSEVKNAIELSKVKAKDKSYYYWSRKATDEAPAPVEAPKQVQAEGRRVTGKLADVTADSHACCEAGGDYSLQDHQ